MAMVVKNNLSAMQTLNRLNKNSSALAKSLEKVSSGQKIVGAKDDSSAYAISEKMREQIRTLAQDNQNVQNGSSLFKVAAGGIDNIVEELRNLKELAINAANDTNTDEDRATIQKSFNQKMANINDIATTTNYNGKILLDGRYSQHSAGNISTSTATENILPTPPTGSVTTISSGNYTIDSDGIFEIASGYTGTITVNAQNVKITQANSSTALQNVSIVTSSSGNTNLWIEGLIINSGQNQSFIKFQGENNTLIAEGNNTLNYDGTVAGLYSAAINVGGGLTITGEENSALTINYTTSILNNRTMGAAIGSGREEASSADITITGNITVDVTTDFGAGIGAGETGGSRASIGNITISGNATVKATSNAGRPGIGAGDSADVGDITITDNATVIVDFFGIGAGIGSGPMDSRAGNITINGNANVTATSGDGAGIGSGSMFSSVGDIIIGGNAVVNAKSAMGAAIGAGDMGASAGNIIIGENATVTADGRDFGTAIGSGMDSTVGDIIISGNATVTATRDNGNSPGVIGKTGSDSMGGTGDITISSSATVNAGSISTNSGTVSNGETSFDIPLSEPKETKIFTSSTPLKIHHGTRANQATNFFLEDMHTKSLGTENLVNGDGSFINQSDKDRYEALGDNSVTPNQKQIDWLETLKAAQNKSLDDISVTTQKNSNIAIRVLDGAIDYALDESTRVGAYLQRLDCTDQNITTMGENVQSAESTIRDADMAKEMTEYTKNNVLLQAAQSMLAQANQSSSQVLSLLQ